MIFRWQQPGRKMFLQFLLNQTSAAVSVTTQCVQYTAVYVGVLLHKSPSVQMSASNHQSSSPIVCLLLSHFQIKLVSFYFDGAYAKKCTTSLSKSSRINNYWTMLSLCAGGGVKCVYVFLSLPLSGFGHLCWQQLWGFRADWVSKRGVNRVWGRQTASQTV